MNLKFFQEEDILILPKKQGEKISGAFIAALHIHFGVANHQQAINVINRVNKNLMEEFKFSYSNKRMSKYIEMAGEKNLIPPEIKNWDHYFELMKNMNAVDDPTQCWWLVRINPIGTVELRIADVCKDMDMVKKIVTKFSCLAKEAIDEKVIVAA